jgi:hypothetical protein
MVVDLRLNGLLDGNLFARKAECNMTEFEKLLQGAAALEEPAHPVNLDRLVELVESQISNVIGGGYSQYYCAHEKDADSSSTSCGHSKDAV